MDNGIEHTPVDRVRRLISTVEAMQPHLAETGLKRIEPIGRGATRLLPELEAPDAQIDHRQRKQLDAWEHAVRTQLRGLPSDARGAIQAAAPLPEAPAVPTASQIRSLDLTCLGPEVQSQATALLAELRKDAAFVRAVRVSGGALDEDTALRFALLTGLDHLETEQG
jgi:hypothetical protein